MLPYGASAPPPGQSFSRVPHRPWARLVWLSLPGGTDPSEEARETTINYGPSPVASATFSVLSSHFLFSSFSGLPKRRTAGTGRLGREFSGLGSDGNGYTAQVTLFLAGTSGQRCQSVCTSRACRTSNNSHHFWSIYSEPG